MLDDFFHAPSDERVVVVAIEGKALPHAIQVRRQGRSEPVEGNLVVVVEVLQHANYLADGTDVRVQCVIIVVERLNASEVGVGEVDTQDQMQPSTIDDIGEKGIAVHLYPP